MLEFGFQGLKKMMNKQMVGILRNAPFKFAPDNGLAYFEDPGWRVVDAESVFVAACRFRRLPLLLRPLAWLPQPDLRNSYGRGHDDLHRAPIRCSPCSPD